MPDLHTEIEVVGSVTYVKPRGNLTTDSILEITECGFYGLTRQVFWDIRDCSLDLMSRDEYFRLSTNVRNRSVSRQTISACFALKNVIDLRQFRYFTLISARQTGHRVRQFLTLDMDAAWDWLKSVEHLDSWETVEHDVPMGTA